MKWNNEARIGIVVFAAIVIFIGGVIFLRGIDLRSKQYSLNVFYSRVNGLRTGDRVTVAGLTIGSVETMALVEGKIQVKLSVQTKAQLPHDSKAVIKSETIMGGKFIEITPGKSQTYLKNSDTLSGEYEADLSELTATLSPISTNILGILAGVDSTFNELTRKRIREMILNLGQTSTYLQKTVNTEGSHLNLALADYDSLALTLTKFANTLDTIASGQRNNIESSVVDLRSMASNLHRVSARLTRAGESLDTILSTVKAGKGTMGKLVQDEKLYNDLDTLAVNLNALAKDIRENPKRYFNMSIF
jgi:phospholipid/cholesterol/gamma-HCH transport system substrate-binding protein